MSQNATKHFEDNG